MQIFGKNLVQFSRNLGKMIWWHSKQKEKWESQNKLFSCVSSLVLTITSFTQRNLFCHQWILTRFRDRKSTSFQKKSHQAQSFFASIPQYTSTPLRVVSISVIWPTLNFGCFEKIMQPMVQTVDNVWERKNFSFCGLFRGSILSNMIHTFSSMTLLVGHPTLELRTEPSKWFQLSLLHFRWS